MRWMSLDPGLRYTGYALWNDSTLEEWGLLRGGEGDWLRRAKWLAVEVKDRMLAHHCELLVTEYPQEMGGAGSRGDIALKSGSVRKLATFVGILVGKISSALVRVELVEPMTWKGQVPKTVTLKRVLRDYPQVVAAKHDVIDAIGIGRWRLRAQGKKRGA